MRDPHESETFSQIQLEARSIIDTISGLETCVASLRTWQDQINQEFAMDEMEYVLRITSDRTPRQLSPPEIITTMRSYERNVPSYMIDGFDEVRLSDEGELRMIFHRWDHLLRRGAALLRATEAVANSPIAQNAGITLRVHILYPENPLDLEELNMIPIATDFDRLREGDTTALRLLHSLGEPLR